jgi:FeS assembly SUF system protein
MWNFDALTPPEPAGDETTGMTSDPLKTLEIKPHVIEALSTIFDPEIPVNIYELGLIYDILIDATGTVGIRMTLTAPACPAAQTLPAEVRRKIQQIPGVAGVKLDIVWDPPWDQERMSDAARLQLGLL